MSSVNAAEIISTRYNVGIPRNNAAPAPIVVDLGSWQTRAGYANEPVPCILFDTKISKGYPKNDDSSSYIVGEGDAPDCYNKTTTKSLFERDVITNFTQAEPFFDHIFKQLASKAYDVPIAVTEVFANPTRASLNEILFEGYRSIKVGYAIDALASAYYNTKLADGFVCSFQNRSTVLFPILGGNLDSEVKKINFGGSDACQMLLTAFQLKYPFFPIHASFSEIESAFHHYSYVSEDYSSEAPLYKQKEYAREKDVAIKYQNEQSAEQVQAAATSISANKQRAAAKLKAIAAERKKQKAAQAQLRYAQLSAIFKATQDLDPVEYLEYLQNEGFKNEKDFKNVLKQATIGYNRYADESEKVPDIVVEDTEPSYLSTPDLELTDTQIGVKRKQKMLKAAADARERVKKAKEDAIAAEAAALAAEEAERETNLGGYIEKLRARRAALTAKISQREQLKTELKDRSSRISAIRIATLSKIAENFVSQDTAIDLQEDAQFAANCELLKSIDDEELAEKEESELLHIEETLLQYDLDFALNSEEGKEDYLEMFFNGPNGDSSGAQLHFNIERIRIPEIFFDPQIIGLDQAGIVEVFSCYQRQSRFESIISKQGTNILLTGGVAKMAGLCERLKREITSILPENTKINIQLAKDPILDAWKGLAQWITNYPAADIWITSDEYYENGANFFKRWQLSNFN